MSARTLTELFFDAVERYANHPAAFRYKADGTWRSVTHRAVAERVQALAVGLRELSLGAGEKVAILSETRLEWTLADYACLCIRATDVPIYPTLPANQVEYILRDSGAAAVFCSTAAQVEKIQAVRAGLPALRHIIAFDPQAGSGVIPLADVEQRGRAGAAKYPRFKEDALAVRPDDLATLIYTSGTTGQPKGVMLSHGNICSNVNACVEVLRASEDDSCLAWLPLSHILERMVEYYFLDVGVTINFAESVDTVAPNLVEVHPTIVAGVPRLYEKVYARVLESALSGSALKRRIFLWAKRIGEAWTAHRLAGIPVPLTLRLRHALADRLVFAKLRARTGGRIKFFVSGSAPLAPEVARFFYSAGLPVIEGYGLTETSPVLTLNPLQRLKLGAVGKPIPGVLIKIAPDGEILAKGPNIMRGYYNKPDETREAIDADGWFHTGDIGELDADGYLKITDRKKDLLKTAGGKYIAPQPIENTVRLNKFVASAVVLGDQRKFPIILIVPNFENLERWAKERGLAYASQADLIRLADVKAKMEREVMGGLRDLAKFEMPKKVVLLERDFTIESGELTPSLKVKRRQVEKNCKDLIDRVYAEADPTAAAVEG
ncbi:MAG: long-chain fatty acid--CoA ligase [Gemmatimonadetes bacterium]|nr:MAG: long-chain fatty acid--CoA ligase [Gemmatimonadota bacterium]TLY54116.1 MAG: long-chain fatty acid--CoA ligase [Gemmatimonadota bacterium]